MCLFVPILLTVHDLTGWLGTLHKYKVICSFFFDEPYAPHVVAEANHRMLCFDGRKTYDQETLHGFNIVSAGAFRWERFLKRTVLSTNSICTRITPASVLVPRTDDRITSVSLHVLFPILKNSRVSGDGLKMQLLTIAEFRVQVVVSFETQLHGIVTIIGVSADTSMNHQCNMEFVMTNDAGPELIMTTYSDLPASHFHYITMVVPYTPCVFCKKTAKKLWKCCKCWDDLRFPVRYCSKACQVADFPRHRPMCGAKGLRYEGCQV